MTLSQPNPVRDPKQILYVKVRIQCICDDAALQLSSTPATAPSVGNNCMALTRGPAPWKKTKPWNRQSSSKRKGKGKGKGKGKAKGEVQGQLEIQEIERLVKQGVEIAVDQIMRGKGKSKSKGKGKGKGNAEATAEQEEQAKADQAAKLASYITESNRENTDVVTTGRLERRAGTHGWILLDEPNDLTAELKTKLDEMCSQYRALIKAKGRKDRLFSCNVVFLHNREMQKDQELPDEGDELKFKLYIDKHGVGATEIEITKKVERQRWPRFALRRRW